MTLYWIGYGVMTVACVLSICANILLRKAMKKAHKALDDQSNELDSQTTHIHEAVGFRFKLINAEFTPAEMREDETLPMFIVERTFGDARIVCKKIFYDPQDPDDREYKRIHAEEVAEILNEKP